MNLQSFPSPWDKYPSTNKRVRESNLLSFTSVTGIMLCVCVSYNRNFKVVQIIDLCSRCSIRSLICVTRFFSSYFLCLVKFLGLNWSWLRIWLWLWLAIFKALSLPHYRQRELHAYSVILITMEPRFKEVAREWGNWFVMSRVCYNENLDFTNSRKNNQNVCCIEG